MASWSACLVSRFLVPHEMSSALQKAYICGRGRGGVDAGREGGTAVQQPSEVAAQTGGCGLQEPAGTCCFQRPAPRPARSACSSGPRAGACLQHVEENGLHDPVLEAGADDGQNLAVQQRGEQDAADGRHEDGHHQAQLVGRDADERVVGVGGQEAAGKQGGDRSAWCSSHAAQQGRRGSEEAHKVQQAQHGREQPAAHAACSRTAHLIDTPVKMSM